MKSNLLPTENFIVRDCFIGNTNCKLVFPTHSSIPWTEDNLIFRSSIWTSAGELISPGFKKFFNLDERPDLFPFDGSLQHTDVIEKIDGSLLIVSKYGGELIVRTRGTTDARQMENGDEILELRKIYPQVFGHKLLDHEYTLLFEWTTPRNRIVLDYGDKPDIWLVGIVNHRDYSYFGQVELDNFAEAHKLNRPQRYHFTSMSDLLLRVKDFENQEGVVIYYGGGQHMRKVKSVKYLTLHALKSVIDSDEAIVDLFIEFGKPGFSEFLYEINTNYDFEISQVLMPAVSRVCDGYKEYQKMLAHMQEFVNDDVRPLPTRKAQAQAILAAYGNTGKSGLVFTILDNKPVPEATVKKLLLQIMARGK